MASTPLLRSHITCNLCFEILANPQALKCLHVYCYNCIQRFKRGNQVHCPECRETCFMTEVKKDFRTQTLIDVYNKQSSTVEEVAPVGLAKPTKCDVCKKVRKPVKSFCTICEEFLCVDCEAAHRGSKASKEHKLTDFVKMCEAKVKEIKKEIKKLDDAMTRVDQSSSGTRDMINQIGQNEVRQIAEVNRHRKDIVDRVDGHHDKLIENIKSINQNLKKTLEQGQRLFTQCEQKIKEKASFLSDVSQGQDYSLLQDTLLNLRENIEKELMQFHSDLPQFDTGFVSPVTVVKGEEWDPLKSTRIDLTKTGKVPKQQPTGLDVADISLITRQYEIKCHADETVKVAKQQGQQNPTRLDVPETELITEQDARPLQAMMQHREIHQRYGQVKSVKLQHFPTKMCVYGDELWVGGARKGVFVYNFDLELIKHIKNSHFKDVASILKTTKYIIVCDCETGLHCLNQQGRYLGCISEDCHSDIALYDNKLYALSFKEHAIDLFSRTQISWVKDTACRLSHYNDGCIFDKFCVTNTGIYLSCYNAHCVQCYSHTGQFVYQTGKYMEGGGVGEFCYPYLSDVDSGGRRVFVCDSINHRLQVLDTDTREWSEVTLLEGVKLPLSAGVGDKHLWVGTNWPNKLLKYEMNGE